MRADTFINQVLAKCEILAKSRFWLSPPALRPKAWLNNFQESHKLAAAVLLDHFIFFPDAHTDTLLLAAFESLNQKFLRSARTGAAAAILRQDFLSRAYFTRVEGERPSPTDSGNLICRKARQVLRVNEAQIIDPSAALKHAINGSPIVFLDDFVGSGQQFIHTWNREYNSFAPKSFSAAHADSKFEAHYLCLLTTAKGAKTIASHAAGMQMHAAHTLDERYSITNLRDPGLVSLFPSIATEISDLLTATAPKLILPNYLKPGKASLYGFHELGLTVAFEHSVPDATLPIYWAKGSDDFVPLLERR